MRTPGLSFWIMGSLAGLLTGCAAPGTAKVRSVGSGSGVPWTILVLELEGPYAIRNSERMADVLRKARGLSPGQVWVTHDPDSISRVYYGSYRTSIDPKTGTRIFPKQIELDLRTIKGTRFDDGVNHFALALRVRKPVPDVGRPEWSLQRVDKPFTLQVAAFEADAVENYKEAAAKWCEKLREKGYEAYYYHASVSSMVTVGAFGKEDVNVVSGRMVYSPRITRLQQDEALRYNYVNGDKLFVIDQGRKVPVPSQLRLVPGHEDEQLNRYEEFRPSEPRR